MYDFYMVRFLICSVCFHADFLLSLVRWENLCSNVSLVFLKSKNSNWELTNIKLGRIILKGCPWNTQAVVAHGKFCFEEKLFHKKSEMCGFLQMGVDKWMAAKD